MDSIKDWLVNVLIQKMGPSAVRGAILGVVGWLAMRNGILAPFGIVSDAATHTTVIHWDQLSVWAIAALPAVTAAVIKLLNHHAEAAVTGTPQSGVKTLGILLAVLALWPARPAQADMAWSVDGVTFQIPTRGTDILPILGADVRFREFVGGAAGRFINIYDEVGGDLGVCGVFPNQGANTQPYIGADLDLRKHLPAASLLTDLKLIAGARYDTTRDGSFFGHVGAVLGVSWEFGQ